MTKQQIAPEQRHEEVIELARELVEYMKNRAYAPSVACAALLEVHLKILKAMRPHETIEEAAVELIEILKRDFLKS